MGVLRRSLRLFAAVVLVGVSACSGVPKFDPVSRFDPSLLVVPAVVGSGSVGGQAFLRSSDGEVKRGAGVEVLLVPESPWTREWFEQIVREGKRPTDSTYFERVGDFARRTRADIDGRFCFEKVPAGRWFVTSLITWTRREAFQTMDWGWGLHPWDYGPGRFRGGIRARYYPYYPCYNQVWEKEETVGGFAYAEIAVAEGERVEGLVVTR